MLPIKVLLTLERRQKRLLSLIYDTFAIGFSLYLSAAILLNTLKPTFTGREWLSLTLTIVITLLCFIRFGMYRAILRYMMLPALSNIFFSVLASTLCLLFSGWLLHQQLPFHMPLLYSAFAILLLGGPRIFIRNLYYHHYRRKKPNVFIYGAGSTGRELAYALINGEEYHPVVILDDDITKSGQIICGLRVHHSDEFQRLHALYQPQKLLLAINNIHPRNRLKLVEKLAEWPIQVQSVPSVEDIAVGRAHLTEIRDLDIADLLGRQPVTPHSNLMRKQIEHRNVLVTGAGGSIGAELCQQILTQRPTKIVLFELNEFNLYRIDQQLKALKQRLGFLMEVVPLLGSIQHQNRLTHVINEHKIDTLYHAAAYKHVPLVEENIIEGIRNNVFGTLAMAKAAIKGKVKNVILISTDKAVRPTNIMGTTKRLAELILQALADEDHQTQFAIVRFGNVLGSSGSVVPLFRRQIHQGGPITVTHPDITRYFMLISEAAQLVIQAGAFSKNGQVFVLDMGKPVKILALAQKMIRLMGYSPMTHKNAQKANQIEIQFTGLRPGEKLYEELLIGDNVVGTAHPKIMAAQEKKLSWLEMNALLNTLNVHCHQFNLDGIRDVLNNAPTDYRPTTPSE